MEYNKKNALRIDCNDNEPGLFISDGKGNTNDGYVPCGIFFGFNDNGDFVMNPSLDLDVFSFANVNAKFSNVNGRNNIVKSKDVILNNINDSDIHTCSGMYFDNGEIHAYNSYHNVFSSSNNTKTIYSTDSDYNMQNESESATSFTYLLASSHNYIRGGGIFNLVDTHYNRIDYIGGSINSTDSNSQVVNIIGGCWNYAKYNSNSSTLKKQVTLIGAQLISNNTETKNDCPNNQLIFGFMNKNNPRARIIIGSGYDKNNLFKTTYNSDDYDYSYMADNKSVFESLSETIDNDFYRYNVVEFYHDHTRLIEKRNIDTITNPDRFYNFAINYSGIYGGNFSTDEFKTLAQIKDRGKKQDGTFPDWGNYPLVDIKIDWSDFKYLNTKSLFDKLIIYYSAMNNNPIKQTILDEGNCRIADYSRLANSNEIEFLEFQLSTTDLDYKVKYQADGTVFALINTKYDSCKVYLDANNSTFVEFEKNQTLRVVKESDVLLKLITITDNLGVLA